MINEYLAIPLILIGLLVEIYSTSVIVKQKITGVVGQSPVFLVPPMLYILSSLRNYPVFFEGDIYILIVYHLLLFVFYYIIMIGHKK